MRKAGASLARSLYDRSTTILLSGELGAGKTTFLSGFAEALGQPGTTSPTYALEQRYHSKKFGEWIHMDLYRLRPDQARELVAASHEHGGLRCIEWPERLEGQVPEGPIIEITISEEGTGRRMAIEFRDLPLPEQGDIETWRRETRLPAHIVRHCEGVAAAAVFLTKWLLEKENSITRPQAVQRAAQVHDLLRFLDFRPDASPSDAEEATADDRDVWDRLRQRYHGQSHEAACASFLRERGYEGLASIVAVHGLHVDPALRDTTEKLLLAYADKRVIGERFTSVEERFSEFRERYGKGHADPRSAAWFDDTKQAERLLFPRGIPSEDQKRHGGN